MTTSSGWKPKDKDVIQALVMAAIKSSGSNDPAQLPHLIRQRLEGQASGADVDQVIASTIADLQKKGELK